MSSDLHVIFNGPSKLLKVYTVTSSSLMYTFPCHDIGIADGEPGDKYGHHHAMPPGMRYLLGAPITLDPPEPAYGYFFTPIIDDPAGDLRIHGRSELGIHGGGSDLPYPFALAQGWEYTYGCLRLQNIDNQVFVSALRICQAGGNTAHLDVVWS